MVRCVDPASYGSLAHLAARVNKAPAVNDNKPNQPRWYTPSLKTQRRVLQRDVPRRDSRSKVTHGNQMPNVTLHRSNEFSAPMSPERELASSSWSALHS